MISITKISIKAINFNVQKKKKGNFLSWKLNENSA